MRTFKDADAREWTLRVDVLQLKRVKASLNLELVGLLADGFQGLAKLFADPPALVDVLFCLCRDEAERRKITDEDFGRALYGDPLDAAADALVQAVVDFFPSRQQAPTRAAWAKARAMESAAMEEAAREVEALDVSQMLTAWRQRSGGRSGPAPESPGLTPTP